MQSLDGALDSDRFWSPPLPLLFFLLTLQVPSTSALAHHSSSFQTLRPPPASFTFPQNAGFHRLRIHMLPPALPGSSAVALRLRAGTGS